METCLQVTSHTRSNFFCHHYYISPMFTAHSFPPVVYHVLNTCVFHPHCSLNPSHLTFAYSPPFLHSHTPPLPPLAYKANPPPPYHPFVTHLTILQFKFSSHFPQSTLPSNHASSSHHLYPSHHYSLLATTAHLSRLPGQACTPYTASHTQNGLLLFMLTSLFQHILFRCAMFNSNSCHGNAVCILFYYMIMLFWV
jgi:hypothetical protein